MEEEKKNILKIRYWSVNKRGVHLLRNFFKLTEKTFIAYSIRIEQLLHLSALSSICLKAKKMFVK